MAIRTPVPAYTAKRPCAPFSAGCLPPPRLQSGVSSPAERGLFSSLDLQSEMGYNNVC